MDILNQIYEVSRKVANTRIERLRIEEELLINYVRNASNKNMSIKAKAFERISAINKQQLDILGNVLKKSA